MRFCDDRAHDERLRDLAAILAIGVRRLLHKPVIPPHPAPSPIPSLSENSLANQLEQAPENSVTVHGG